MVRSRGSYSMTRRSAEVVDGGIGGLDWPGHPPLAGIPGERDGAPARGGTAERLREFRGSGGRERFYRVFHKE